MKYIVCIAFLSCLTMLFADMVYLKNGLKIEGQIDAIGQDSVSIKTSTGIMKIAVADIEKIETAKPSEGPVVTEGAIPKSIKGVGYGCLGGVIAGSAAGILAVWTDGFGDSGEATFTIIAGSVIIGVLAGVALGGK